MSEGNKNIAEFIHNNDKGSCDWVIVKFNDEIVWEGHNLPRNADDFIYLFKELAGVSEFKVRSVTDEQIRCLGG